MTYEYTLTPALKELADEARKNDGQLFRSQVLQIVTNDRSSFYKLSRLGFHIKKSPIGKTGKNYVVEITPPAKKIPGLKRASTFKRFERKFFSFDLPTRLLIYSLVLFGFLMLAKLISEIL